MFHRFGRFFSLFLLLAGAAFLFWGGIVWFFHQSSVRQVNLKIEPSEQILYDLSAGEEQIINFQIVNNNDRSIKIVGMESFGH